jgi:hypothetical protein
VATSAAKFEKTTGMTALQKLAVAAVPAAQAVSKVATKIEAQSGQLVNTVSGIKPATAKRPSAAKRSRTVKAG